MLVGVGHPSASGRPCPSAEVASRSDVLLSSAAPGPPEVLPCGHTAVLGRPRPSSPKLQPPSEQRFKRGSGIAQFFDDSGSQMVGTGRVRVPTILQGCTTLTRSAADEWQRWPEDHSTSAATVKHVWNAGHGLIFGMSGCLPCLVAAATLDPDRQRKRSMRNLSMVDIFSVGSTVPVTR